jgi:predicted thioesterase
MNAALQVGMEATDEFEVDGRLLTDVGGTLGSEVLSTPGMIGMMERTAAGLVQPALEEGKATVGFEVFVRHVGAARKGARCRVHARLEEIVDGRKLRFAVEVTADDGRTIGLGRHERRVIDVRSDRFGPESNRSGPGSDRSGAGSDRSG